MRHIFHFLSVLCISFPWTAFSQDIELVNNGYENVLVAISGCVEEDARLVDQIKMLLTDASHSLFVATRQRTFFRSVSILIPSSWERKPEYRVANGSESFSKANFRIDVPSSRYLDRPYTKQPASPVCGNGWDHIHLTPDFVNGNGNGGWWKDLRAKMVVQQWGHFRFGLGEEYPRQATSDKKWYLDDGVIIPVRCARTMRFSNPSRSNGCKDGPSIGGTNENCRYEPSRGRQRTEASLMFDISKFEYWTTIDGFCDNDNSRPDRLHNPSAPNHHNTLCESRSAWEVMRAHPDFAGGVNPANHSLNATPTFTIRQRSAQQGANRVMLVLDRSGSMSNTIGTYTRLEKMNQNAAAYIMSVPNGTYVGIIEFTGGAQVNQPLTSVTGQASRQLLISNLPPSANGGTCIGCGVLMAITELAKVGGTAAGGRALVITDGQDSTNYGLLTAAVLDKAVEVDAILLTDAAADTLGAMCTKTGGRAYFDNAQSSGTDMVLGLLDTVEHLENECTSAKQVQLLVKGQTIAGGRSFYINTFIDSTVGYNTEFSFTYPKSPGSSAIYVTLQSPTGVKYTSDDSTVTTIDDKIWTLYMKIPGVAEFGKWNMSVGNKHAAPFDTQMLVKSSSASAHVQPITVSAFISDSAVDLSDSTAKIIRLYAEVMRGYDPVLAAQVKAIVTNPQEEYEVMMLDDGTGADATMNDGLYSAFFVQYTRNGKYNFRIEASHEDATVTSVPSGNRARRNEPTKEGSSFVRIAAGGYFQISNHPTNDGKVPPSVVIPPAQVTDLQLTEMSFEDKTLTFQWTAMGADMDAGIANRYVLRYSENFTSLRGNFNQCDSVTSHNVIRGSLDVPKPAYSLEEITVKILHSQIGRTYHYALKSYDDHDNQSPRSNIVPAGVYAAITFERGSDPMTSNSPTHHSLTSASNGKPTPDGSTAMASKIKLSVTFVAHAHFFLLVVSTIRMRIY